MVKINKGSKTKIKSNKRLHHNRYTLYNIIKAFALSQLTIELNDLSYY